MPIYRVDSTLVANNYGDLWDGSIANPISINENDINITMNFFAWTGTNTNGSTFAIDPLCGTIVRLGRVTQTDSKWINFGSTSSPSVLRLYAMSSIQEIPTIPEPTTIIASLLVGAGLLPLKRRKSKKTK